MPARTSAASSWAWFGNHLRFPRNRDNITQIPSLSFYDDEVAKDVSFVEEVVMEGNPKAPRFLVEPHIEAPREAYVQHVRLITQNSTVSS